MTGQWSTEIVVLGGGLAGLRAASVAAEAGRRVVLIEKRDRLGGSAALSAGMFWTAPDLESYRARVPAGNVALGERVISDYDANLDAIRRSGVFVSDQSTDDVMGFGRGFTFDVKAYLGHLEERLLKAGGEIRTGLRVRAIEPSAIQRYRLVIESDEGEANLETNAIVFATGGFQGSPGARATWMPDVGEDILLRSNPGSTGDGLRLASELGAATAGDLGTFYGHLISHPVSGFIPDRFMLFSQYYSNHGILVAADGRRFADESRGDELLNQDLAELDGMRAFLIVDHETRSTYGASEPFANFGRLDRFEFAVEHGARHAVADTLDALAVALGTLGVDEGQLRRTLAGDVGVSTLASRVSGSEPPTAAQLGLLRSGPFYALEVQPAVTFTLGGIAIDAATRVIAASGSPLDGVFAAGADIGGLSNYGYVGGLAPAHITGSIAGVEAVASC
ncbi:FAD-dependent oxidoreductase [Salinibacterium sp. ZJ450]|uniref:FAD-dependent oxidoreductase n=1 Tax=Salinibacterium sp. ZJ450 TaxID=2708338 RepID=UPI00141E9A08|nr:FAD-dependent oxidoreductase [Salinibacterium sp. ZJ450]